MNKPLMDACGCAGAAAKGDAVGCNMPKGDAPVAFPPRVKAEDWGAAISCGFESAVGFRVKGLAGGDSAAGLIENGDGGCGGEVSEAAKLGDAAAKGLIGNA